jgi:Hint domain
VAIIRSPSNATGTDKQIELVKNFAARQSSPSRTRGCLSDGIPTRDLFVSPEHAMLIDGLLIPAARLVNGRTITQPEPPADIHYIHVELADRIGASFREQPDSAAMRATSPIERSKNLAACSMLSPRASASARSSLSRVRPSLAVVLVACHWLPTFH